MEKEKLISLMETFLLLVILTITILVGIRLDNLEDKVSSLEKETEQLKVAIQELDTKVKQELNIEVIALNKSKGEEVLYINATETIKETIANISNQLQELEEERTEIEEEEFIRVAGLVAKKSINNIELPYTTFKEVYNQYLPIFIKNYNQSIDLNTTNGEYIQTLEELKQNNYQGDCDDYAMFFYIVALKLGYDATYVTGSNNYGDSHAWTNVYINDTWVEFDSTSYNKPSAYFMYIREYDLINNKLINELINEDAIIPLTIWVE